LAKRGMGRGLDDFALARVERWGFAHYEYDRNAQRSALHRLPNAPEQYSVSRQPLPPILPADPGFYLHQSRVGVILPGRID
jgi:hypothetical protein